MVATIDIWSTPLAALIPVGSWIRKGPVIYPDPTKPNAFSAGEATLIQPEGNALILTGYSVVWKMWYSQSTGIYYAESPDGLGWTSYAGSAGNGSVIVSRQRPFVVKNGSTYYMYCAAGAGAVIDEYTSTDGVTWTLANAAVISGAGLTYSNSGGVVSGGTLYLFAENGGGIDLFTSTDFHTFTKVTSGIISGSVGGPSVPYLVNGTWYIWCHALGAPSGILRYSAPALTGPWTNSEAGRDFSVQTLDEGVNTSAGQAVDPFVIEVGGTSYLYYSGTSNNNGNSQIKLAMASMPLAQLVLTPGGSQAASVENQGVGGLSYDIANNAINAANQALENVGKITNVGAINAKTSGTQIAVSGGFTATNYMSAAGFFVGNNQTVGINGGKSAFQFSTSGYIVAKGPVLLAGPYSAAGTALPAASGTYEGAMTFVSDASSPTAGAVYASGGSSIRPVFCDGTNWRTCY